jgi:hypothetical protein
VDFGRSEHVNVVERIADFERGSRTWQSLDKGKALVSNSLYQVRLSTRIRTMPTHHAHHHNNAQVVQGLPSLAQQTGSGSTTSKPLPKPPTPRFDDGRQPSFRKPSVSMD